VRGVRRDRWADVTYAEVELGRLLADPPSSESEDAADAVARAMTDDRTPFDLLDEKRQAEAVRKAMGKLTPREQWVIGRRVGWDGGESETQAEVAAMVGVSRNRIGQIEKKALERLARSLGHEERERFHVSVDTWRDACQRAKERPRASVLRWDIPVYRRGSFWSATADRLSRALGLYFVAWVEAGRVVVRHVGRAKTLVVSIDESKWHLYGEGTPAEETLVAYVRKSLPMLDTP
jgi:RNA polymerase sigma factor (sigma-70 family)